MVRQALSYIVAKSPEALTEQSALLMSTSLILGPPQWDGKRWVLWYLVDSAALKLNEKRKKASSVRA